MTNCPSCGAGVRPPPSRGATGPCSPCGRRMGGGIEADSIRIVALAKADSGAAMAEARTALERTLEAVGDTIGRPRKNREAYRNFAEELAKQFREMHTGRSDDPYEVLADTVQVAISCFGYASYPGHSSLDASERAHAELALSLATTIYTHFGRMLQ